MERKTEDALARWPYGRPTRADSHMQAITLEVIIAVVFGVTDPDRAERLRAATLALMRVGNSRRFFVQTIIVTARNKGWDGPFPRIRAAMAAVDAIVLEEAAERRHSGDLDQDDVFGMFLRAHDANSKPMPDSELCDAMRTLLLGGHETTASTLAWILERVTRHPDELARLRRRPSTATTTTSTPSSRRRCVCARCSRSLGGSPPRTSRCGDLTIPAGTLIIPHITLVHRRPDLYPDPLTFRPAALPRQPRRDLHVDPVRRRSKTLHRRRVLARRNADRAAHNAPPRAAAPDEPARRTRRTTHGHDRPRPRRDRHAQTAPTLRAP